MDENVLKLSIAGLMHDIGKLADECAMEVSPQYLNNNADIYQPFFNGRHSHRHAVYTAAFIEQMEKILPSKFNRHNWGLEDSFINIAAGHHKPESPLQWIVAMADRLSSGWDRATFDSKYNKAVAPKDYRKTRMVPIFETLLKPEDGRIRSSRDYRYHYPLMPVSPKSIFPVNRNTPDSAGSNPDEEYRKLFGEFVVALGQLKHREENLGLWLEHFDSLLMIYASHVPAARAGQVIPDVSLYDHLRSTSALATALYRYHKETESMEVSTIRDETSQKFLLIGGDFYGIQNFIFSDSREAGRNRSKILRGRSFAVSLFSELAADLLCRRCGLPCTSVVFNAAGKFVLLAPNLDSVRRAVAETERQVNDWLFRVSLGESSLGMSCVEASAGDFVGGEFAEVWERLGTQMETRKFHKVDLDRFGGVVGGYLDLFDNTLSSPLCPFCGKRPAEKRLENSTLIGGEGSTCLICHDHIFLGTHLVKKNRLAVTSADAALKSDKLLEPIYGEYQVAFVEGALSELARKGKLYKYWDISCDPSGEVAKDVTARFINGYVPIYSERDLHDDRFLAGRRGDEKKEELIDQIEIDAPKTFSHLACKALRPDPMEKGKFTGIQALGVLKADVDQLGLLMACGIPKEQYSLSRLATLSRQFHWYFAVYLPHLLSVDERFQDVYTVFAGGDDLFLIGPWNRMIELAVMLRSSFENYTCTNPEIHFSAGITLHKAHTPLQRMAEESENALEKAKITRNSITLFGETATWEQFLGLQSIKETLMEWREKGLVNNAMLYRLNEFIEMAEAAKRVLGLKQITPRDLECLKWHSMFHYCAERNVGRGLARDEKKKAIDEFAQSLLWLNEYKGNLKMALWNVLYQQRRAG